jgi:hypothetical protein
MNSGEFFTKVQIEQYLSCNISNDAFSKLKAGYTGVRKKYFKPGMRSQSIHDFLERNKEKGISRKIRNILDADLSNLRDVEKAFKNFTVSIGCTDPVPISNITLTAWTMHYLPSDMRDFLFKLYNNRLKVIARACKFNQSINAGCTFCEMKLNLSVCKETVGHLFWDCATTNESVIYAIKYFLNFNVTKVQFFTGEITANNNLLKSCVLSFFNVMQYVTWEFKWQKKLPAKSLFLTRVCTIWTGIYLCSPKLKRCILNSNLFNDMQR